MVGCMFQIETQALWSSLRTLGCGSASALAFVFAPGVYRMPLDVKCQDLLICSSSSMKRSKFRHSCNRVVMINYLHPRLGMLPSTAAHSNALRLFHRPWDRLGEGLCTLCGWFVLQCAHTRILFWLRRSLFHNDFFPIWMCSHQFPTHSKFQRSEKSEKI